jgi:hypothetical protein
MTEFKECDHDNKGYCWRTFSNGSKHFGTQCLQCGDWCALPKKIKQNLPALVFDAPDYDPEIRESWFRDQSRLRSEQSKETILTSRQRLEEYYSSPAWNEFRSARLEFNRKFLNGLCEICRRNPAIQCHHMTYARAYNEWLFDVAALCRECHEAIHGIDDVTAVF